jgi:uncharacterized protein
MHVVIAGGSGFLGHALTRQLIAGGHRVTVLTRSEASHQGGVNVVLWNPDGTADIWARALDGADAVVNLAGTSIAGRRWTDAHKRLVRDSRINATESLVAGVATCRYPPSTFVQGSAVGYYGASLDDDAIDESHAPGSDFLGRVCVEWEAAAQPVSARGCRVVTIRTGLVLARKGGVLPPMALPFRLFAGGPVGTGRQYLPWIHVDDWVSLVAWAIGNPDVSGPLNASAPNPVANEAFSRAIGRALQRPCWLRAPSFAMRALLGREMADCLILQGQRVVPARALAAGFSFGFDDIDDALAAVFG